MRTPRLSMLNPPWGSGITISMGGGTSKSETWIIPCTRTIEVGVCSESGCARRILLRCRVNLLAEIERSVSRSREPSQHSRGDSSGRADTFAYIPAHQRDRRIGESNSDSRRKEFYDRRREAESSHDRGQDYAKDRDRNKDYGKDSERDRHGRSICDPRSSGRDPTPDRRSHSREKVDGHKQEARGDSRDKKYGQDTREKRRDFYPHPARDRSNNCECTQVDDDYTNVCAFFDAAPAANEADRADDRLLSASISHP